MTRATIATLLLLLSSTVSLTYAIDITAVYYDPIQAESEKNIHSPVRLSPES